MGTDHKIVAHSGYDFNVAKLFILGAFRHSRFIRAALSTTFWERTQQKVLPDWWDDEIAEKPSGFSFTNPLMHSGSRGVGSTWRPCSELASSPSGNNTGWPGSMPSGPQGSRTAGCASPADATASRSARSRSVAGCSSATS